MPFCFLRFGWGPRASFFRLLAFRTSSHNLLLSHKKRQLNIPFVANKHASTNKENTKPVGNNPLLASKQEDIQYHTIPYHTT
mmetsp:Transcript_5128/g.10576  ORF Transcript_5128/g.10576 Transcript_5128/m.10576 type:complete len:82 (+) Transcript_5128:86-331(+)